MKNQSLRLLLIFGIALGLRLVNLDARSLWYDEAFAVLFSEKGLDAMLYGTLTTSGGAAADVHPLLYYTTLDGWMRVLGRTPAVVRLYSVLLSLLTLFVIFRLTRDLFDERTAIVGLLIAALAPFYVQYSQEARMYALLGLLLMLATWCYVRGSRSGGAGWWIGLAICAGLSMYTQQLAAFYLLALGMAALLSHQRRPVIGMLAAGVGALLIYAPWLVNLPGQLGKLGSYWINKPTFSEALLTLRSFLFVELEPTSLIVLLVALLAVVLLIIFLIYRSALILSRPNKDRASLALVLWLAFVPMIVMWIGSQWRPVYLTRALLPSALMLYLALAWLLTRARLPTPIRALLIVVGGASFAAGLLSFYRWNTFPHAPFAAADQAIRAQLQPGDQIVHANKITALPMIYYDTSLPHRYIGDVPGSPTDTLALPTQQVLSWLADACAASAAKGANRVWYVVFDEQNPNDLAWFGAHYHQEAALPFNDLKVYLYDQPDSQATSAECSSR